MGNARTTVFLVRHGETEWNREEVFRGRIDCPLNESGRAEGRALGEFLAGREIHGIYSSPLSRAAETAALIAGDRRLPVVTDPAFTDLDFGEWQGLPLKEVREKYAEQYREWRERPGRITFPGGESLDLVRARAWAGLLRIVREKEGQTLLIVTHRVVTKILLCAALGLDTSHFWQIRQDTTAVNCLEYSRDRFFVTLVNDTCHLRLMKIAGRDF
ncbi:MAG TPA: histidine phosphatase family protein [Thermodesulfobacteriota bacterium]|nr:histidine phosphatase family protein [Thermodesulfobacteriota bacterium]